MAISMADTIETARLITNFEQATASYERSLLAVGLKDDRNERLTALNEARTRLIEYIVGDR